jgi:hypothetical protein
MLAVGALLAVPEARNYIRKRSTRERSEAVAVTLPVHQLSSPGQSAEAGDATVEGYGDLLIRPKWANDGRRSERRRLQPWAWLIVGYSILRGLGRPSFLPILVGVLGPLLAGWLVWRVLYFNLAGLFVRHDSAGRYNVFGVAKEVPRSQIASVALVAVKLHPRASPTPREVVAALDHSGRALWRVSGRYYSPDDAAVLARRLNVPIAGGWENPIPAAGAEATAPGICSWYERHNEGVTATMVLVIMPLAFGYVWLLSILLRFSF